MIRAVIFDMDGVIVDTESIHKEAELRTCADYGIAAPIELWEDFKGRLSVDIFSTIIERCCPGRYDAMDLVRHKRIICEEMISSRQILYPGVSELIAAVAAKYVLALATSNTSSAQKLIFDKYGVAPYFTAITTGNDVSHGKPHPEPYLVTVSRLGLPASDCAAIEDSVNGIISARDAGCLTIAITNSFPEDALTKAGAHHVFTSYQGIRTFLGV